MFPYRILIVEDQAFQREYLVNLFREQGVSRLEAAADGEDALSRLKAREFDLVLSDLMMPGLDGVQLIQRLSELKRPPLLAIMSSSSRRVMGSACRLASVLGITVVGQIAKPALPLSIRRLLGKLEKGKRKHDALPTDDRREWKPDELSAALKNWQFQAWFQPKKSLGDGRISAAEALVRWIHPQHGTLMPGEFISSLGQAGLDEALLWLVLEQALRAQALWGEAGFRIPVSVNLPTHLLDDPSLPDRLHDFVVTHAGAPGSIVFELLECSTTVAPSNYYAGACRLRMKGFGLAQDDFGQGYSSFYNLVSTPFTELKIDRALIRGCVEDDGLSTALESIVSLGRQLGLEVVAEGVESKEELAMLRRFECDRVQGFLISEAVAPQLFLQLLMDERANVAYLPASRATATGSLHA
ncbi:EAL domain-containing response regulator [Zestomonas carbonaria]|uniref:Protein-glutamate methylesterase/protein-glutamine glutaminase n=1 Tax=Zestomonas carbonaria TaxID=2762745 RepID=A0A7U7ENL7_9GAMM|nr:EAL domain-containing response regulator [Pseudomonas carbonaria]CAD5107938.1 Protein-glutamate methylesterase/protein-glutamine glutaminase [Pseudomonas carbonaria]